jgi:hypothetical protein
MLKLSLFGHFGLVYSVLVNFSFENVRTEILKT